MRDRMLTVLVLVCALTFALGVSTPEVAVADGTNPVDTFVVPPGGGMPALGGPCAAEVAYDGSTSVGNVTIRIVTFSFKILLANFAVIH